MPDCVLDTLLVQLSLIGLAFKLYIKISTFLDILLKYSQYNSAEFSSAKELVVAA